MPFWLTECDVSETPLEVGDHAGERGAARTPSLEVEVGGRDVAAGFGGREFEYAAAGRPRYRLVLTVGVHVAVVAVLVLVQEVLHPRRRLGVV